jgi:bifunctional DNA-binding transcriptional regulator/antitoxin component of YhaV-PrlF toxin-antitoxin module
MILNGNRLALACLDDKGRVCIPKRIRESAGIGKEQPLFIYAFENVIFLRRADIDGSSVLKMVRGMRT